MSTKRAFISYARADAERVIGIERRLRQLDHVVWLDQALKGGQAWWDEILQQIRDCDVFVAIVSPASIDSRACQRERQYADAIGKPVLPVAISAQMQALPTELSRRQLVDYSVPSEDAAFRLAAAVHSLPPAAPLPATLPEPPEIPLSYLAALVDAASSPTTLTKPMQVEMLGQLETGLRSADADEREGAWHILQLLEDRDDVYADTQRRIDQIRETHRRRLSDTGSLDRQTEDLPRSTARAKTEWHPNTGGVNPEPVVRPTSAVTPSPPPPPRAAPAAPPPPDPPQRSVSTPTPARPATNRAPQPARPPTPMQPGPPPASYLVWGIVTTVLCCLPLGVVSIVSATQVNSTWAAGDYAGALAASNKAKTFAIWSAVVGVITNGIFAVLVLSSMSSPTYY